MTKNSKSISVMVVSALSLVALVAGTPEASAGSIKQAGKLDLEVGGQVVRGIANVDDGRSNQIFIPDGLDNDTELYFAASGKLTEQMTAGLSLTFDADQAGAQYSFDADGDETVADDAEAIAEQFVFFEHTELGTISLGFTGHGGDGANDQVFGQTISTNGGFARQITLIDSDGAQSAITAADQLSDLDPEDDNLIRYDSPSVAGFALGLSLDDEGDSSVGLFYAASVGDIEINAAGHYLNEETGDGQSTYGGSIAAMHSSGFHMAFANGWRRAEGSGRKPRTNRYHIGYETQLNSLGKTDFYGTYRDSEDIEAAGREGEEFIFGITQELESIGGYAALAYSQTSYSDSTATVYEDVDVLYLETSVAF